MAISVTTTKNEYTLDALTTTFSITFDVVKDDNGDAKDLLVSLVEDGETTVLVRNTDYTVSDLTVTYADAVNHAGATLIVARNTPRTQETDFVNNGSYNLQQIEDMSDKLTRIAQEQDTDISDKIVLAESLAEAAQESADNAYASEQKAHDWADKAPDVEVETGEYSAKHWASKASQSSGSAAVSAYDASVYAGQASSARGQSASYALVSEGYANGEQSGTPVGSDSPYYQNNSKYWADVAKQYATGGLFYVGVWTITSQTDYSAISTPRKKGDLFYCQGTSTTIDSVTYTSGDFIVFNQDVAQGTTITTSMIDKIDNTETVTPDNTCTLENKTIDFADNTLTGVQPTLTAGTGIDITGTTISAKQTYSTSEVKTGDVWTDGKPIYKKTISTTLTSYSDSGSLRTFATTLASDVDHYVNSSGYWVRGSRQYSINSAYPNTTLAMIFGNVLYVDEDTHELIANFDIATGWNVTTLPIAVTAYYTKTTD